MGYTYVLDFGVKDYGSDCLSIKITDDDTEHVESVSDFDKDQIDRIIKTLQEARLKKWGE